MNDSHGEAPAPASVPVAAPSAEVPEDTGPPYAECVLCRKPTEYPESVKGSPLCPVCEWREAERTACSG